MTSKATQALVLAPTRELALQVAEAFSRYGAHLPQILMLPIYGGSSYGVQLAGPKRGAQVVVGTPGAASSTPRNAAPWTCPSHIHYLVLGGTAINGGSGGLTGQPGGVGDGCHGQNS